MNLVIGEIVKAQGIKGEVKIKPYSDDLARFASYKTFIVDGCPFKVLSSAVRDGFIFAHLERVNTRNDAEVLVGRKILIDRALVKTEDNEFLVADLLGSEVFLSNGEKIGVLFSVDNYGSADVFTVKDGEAEVKFPFVKKLNLVFSENKIVIDKKAFDEVCCYEN